MQVRPDPGPLRPAGDDRDVVHVALWTRRLLQAQGDEHPRRRPNRRRWSPAGFTGRIGSSSMPDLLGNQHPEQPLQARGAPGARSAAVAAGHPGRHPAAWRPWTGSCSRGATSSSLLGVSRARAAQTDAHVRRQVARALTEDGGRPAERAALLAAVAKRVRDETTDAAGSVGARVETYPRGPARHWRGSGGGAAHRASHRRRNGAERAVKPPGQHRHRRTTAGTRNAHRPDTRGRSKLGAPARGQDGVGGAEPHQDGHRGRRNRRVGAVAATARPAFRDGDLVVLDAGRAEPLDGQVFVVRTGEGVSVKRLRLRDDRWELESDNPTYEPRAVTGQDRLLGQVAWAGPPSAGHKTQSVRGATSSARST